MRAAFALAVLATQLSCAGATPQESLAGIDTNAKATALANDTATQSMEPSIA